MNKLFKIAVFITALMMALPACQEDDPKYGHEFSLSHNSLHLVKDNTFQVYAVPKEGTYTWTSSNTSVVTVSNSGLITAVGNPPLPFDDPNYVPFSETITVSNGKTELKISVRVGYLKAPNAIEIFYMAKNEEYDPEEEDSEEYEESNDPVDFIVAQDAASFIGSIETRFLPSNHNESQVLLQWHSDDEDIIRFVDVPQVNAQGNPVLDDDGNPVIAEYNRVEVKGFGDVKVWASLRKYETVLSNEIEITIPDVPIVFDTRVEDVPLRMNVGETFPLNIGLGPFDSDDAPLYSVLHAIRLIYDAQNQTPSGVITVSNAGVITAAVPGTANARVRFALNNGASPAVIYDPVPPSTSALVPVQVFDRLSVNYMNMSALNAAFNTFHVSVPLTTGAGNLFTGFDVLENLRTNRDFQTSGYPNLFDGNTGLWDVYFSKKYNYIWTNRMSDNTSTYWIRGTGIWGVPEELHEDMLEVIANLDDPRQLVYMKETSSTGSFNSDGVGETVKIYEAHIWISTERADNFAFSFSRNRTAANGVTLASTGLLPGMVRSNTNRTLSLGDNGFTDGYYRVTLTETITGVMEYDEEEEDDVLSTTTVMTVGFTAATP